MDTRKELLRLEAINQCRNLMGSYSLFNSQVRRRELIGLFSSREDVLLEMPWGIYTGQEGLRNRYLREQGDRNDPVGYQKFVGKTVSHEMDTEVIEVAEDLKTAWGCWISPGCDTGVSNGEGQAMWCWSKFAADFIFEDGAWKIWHMRLYHMYRSSFMEKWTDCQFADYQAMLPKTRADRPPTDPVVWEAGMPYPINQPEPPTPYVSYGQRAHRIIAEVQTAALPDRTMPLEPMDADKTRLVRLGDAQACRNMAAKLMYYNAAGRLADAAALFLEKEYVPAHYEGPSPRNVYADALDTELLCVHDDGTAEGCWLALGSITIPKQGERDSDVQWNMAEYRFQFQKTVQGWKIASVHTVPIFHCGYLGQDIHETPYVLPEIAAAIHEEAVAPGSTYVLESVQACRNLMGLFCRNNAAGRSVAALWAGNKDDQLLCPSGAYDGEEAHRAPKPGVLYKLDTEILKVDPESGTAVGCWNSPGYGSRKWYWGKYEVIFRCDNGFWRIWKMAYYPVFKTPMDTPWTKNHGYAPTAALSRLDCQWAADRIHPAGRPEIPNEYGPYLNLSV